MSKRKAGYTLNLSEEKRLAKNKAIKEAGKKTRERRKTQDCKTYTCKIQTNKLTQSQRQALKMLFVEGKWLRNDILNFSEEEEGNGPWDYEIGTTVQVKNKDGEFEERKFNYIGSHLKRGVKEELITNIRGLSARKKKAHKVGKLKFVSELKQLNMTQYMYSLKSDTKVKLQNIPGHVRVRGLNQVKGLELANAKLLNRPNGYYLAITTYQPKENVKDTYNAGAVIGIDMGTKDNIIISNGEKINVVVGQSGHFRRLQQKLARQEKGSNCYSKTKKRIGIQYQKLTNKKNDIGNKIVHELLQNEFVFMQDEPISEWRKLSHKNARVIQHSILGRVKQKLKEHKRVYVLDSSVPTTKQCICGSCNTTLNSRKRTIKCKDCDYVNDRDTHACINMILLGKNNLPVGRRNGGRNARKLVESVSDSLIGENPR
jgi:putative transposase